MIKAYLVISIRLLLLHVVFDSSHSLSGNGTNITKSTTTTEGTTTILPRLIKVTFKIQKASFYFTKVCENAYQVANADRTTLKFWVYSNNSEFVFDDVTLPSIRYEEMPNTRMNETCGSMDSFPCEMGPADKPDACVLKKFNATTFKAGFMKIAQMDCSNVSFYLQITDGLTTFESPEYRFPPVRGIDENAPFRASLIRLAIVVSVMSGIGLVVGTIISFLLIRKRKYRYVKKPKPIVIEVPEGEDEGEGDEEAAGTAVEEEPSADDQTSPKRTSSAHSESN